MRNIVRSSIVRNSCALKACCRIKITLYPSRPFECFRFRSPRRKRSLTIFTSTEASRRPLRSTACIARIVGMPPVHLRNLDLNLLVPLHALLEERHVTRAAKRTFLSQPAMSRSLERLREMFGDPLLVRSGRGYGRTVRGEGILRELE